MYLKLEAQLLNITNQDLKYQELQSKIACANQRENIKNKLHQLRKSLPAAVIFDKIFYSPSLNSCLASYVIEDHPSIYQCEIDAQMYHKDVYVIEDVLTEEYILYQQIACDNFYPDDVDKLIEKLKSK